MKSKEELENVLKDNGLPPHPFYSKSNLGQPNKVVVHKKEIMDMTIKEKIIKGVNKLAKLSCTLSRSRPEVTLKFLIRVRKESIR